MNYRRLDDAIRAAAEWHGGQEREGDAPLPYITHPMEVLMNLRVVGEVRDEELLCAAVLHDVLEETKVRADQIKKLAGLRVRQLVQELTRVEPTAEETKGLSKDAVWKFRALRLLAEIQAQSRDAQQVKLADRLSNVREAKRTKSGIKLDRYLWQTFRILEIVRREVNSGLWDAIRAELPEAEVPEPYPEFASA